MSARGVAGLVLAGILGCSGPARTVVPPPDPPPTIDPAIDAQVSAWVAEMTPIELIRQLHGIDLIPAGGLWRTADNDRLGIPGWAMTDGPRGATAQVSTSFPVAMLRAATWDPELERRVGEVVGREAAAHGASVILAPVANLTVHPRYGRAQETYGDDPTLVGAMATAFVQGAEPSVMATVKHFAANHIENSRFFVDMQIDDAALHEVYLPAFRQAVLEGGSGAVMSAYNKVNGAFCGENPTLLTSILREQWGFGGVVMSDWINGTHDSVASLKAGLDLEMPLDKVYAFLDEDLEAGRISRDDLEAAARRVLIRKEIEGLRTRVRPDPSIVRNPEALALAYETALRGAVLLRDEGALPLADAATIAVVGRLAALDNVGDTGSSDVPVADVVTVLEGLVDRAGADAVIDVTRDALTPDDEAAIAGAGAVVVVVGATDDDEGEYIPGRAEGDRLSAELTPEHQALIATVAALHDRVVVVLEGGSAFIVDPWLDEVQGLVHAFYPGERGGLAIADLLLGRAAFEGRMPMVTARSADHLPPFDNTSDAVVASPFVGQAWLDHERPAARSPLRFGLSPTAFLYDRLTVSGTLVGPEATATVGVRVRNVGDAEGSALVMLYAESTDGSGPRTLVGFTRVRPPVDGETIAEIPVAARRLARWRDGAWTLTDGTWTLTAGPHAGSLPAEGTLTLELPE